MILIKFPRADGPAFPRNGWSGLRGRKGSIARRAISWLRPSCKSMRRLVRSPKYGGSRVRFDVSISAW